MIYTGSYLTPRAVMFSLLRNAQEGGVIGTDMDYNELLKYGAQEFWKFAESVEYVTLLGPTGSTVLGDKQLLVAFDKTSAFGRLLSIPEGTIYYRGNFSKDGPTRFVDALFRPISTFRFLTKEWGVHRFRKDMRERLGQFYGMAVVFEPKQLSDYLAPPPSEPADLTTEKVVSEALIEAYDRGVLTSKADARQIYGSSLGARAFLRAWDRAASQRPQMSAPGRKGILDK